MVRRRNEQKTATFSLYREVDPKALTDPDAPQNLDKLFLMRERPCPVPKDLKAVFDAEKKLLRSLRIENFNSHVTFATDAIAQPTALLATLDAVAQGRLFSPREAGGLLPSGRSLPGWFTSGRVGTLGGLVACFLEQSIGELYWHDRSLRRQPEFENSAVLAHRCLEFWMNLPLEKRDVHVDSALDTLTSTAHPSGLLPPEQLRKRVASRRSADERAFILDCFHSPLRSHNEGEGRLGVVMTAIVTNALNQQTLATTTITRKPRKAKKPKLSVRSPSPRRSAWVSTPACESSAEEAESGKATPVASSALTAATQKASLEWESDESEGEVVQVRHRSQRRAVKKAVVVVQTVAKKPKATPRLEPKHLAFAPIRPWEDVEETFAQPASQEAKVEGKTKPSAFSDEILQICAQLEDHARELQKAQQFVVQRIEYVLSRTVEGGCQLVPYGSAVTGLLTPFSDIDLAISCGQSLTRAQAVDLLQLLSTNLATCHFALAVQPLLSASMPVIKLVADAHAPLGELPRAEHPTRVSADITVQIGEYADIGCSSMRTTAYVCQAKQSFPSFGPVMRLIKCVLSRRDLMTTYRGGLSAYGLAIIYIAFLRTRGLETETCPARCLTAFVDFLSDDFHPEKHAVCLFGSECGGPCLIPKEVCRLSAPLIVLDPTHHLASNVTAGCYLFDEVQLCLRAFLHQTRESALDGESVHDAGVRKGNVPALAGREALLGL